VVDGGQLRVLIGDADAESRVGIEALLASIGCPSEAFDSGGKLLASAWRQDPALVVLDSGLPRPSAYEVCRELRERLGEHLPIVFVSSDRTAVNDEIAALLLGADDYFAKPLHAERFLVRVRRLLARSELAAARAELTQREREVLGMLVKGRRPAEIAELLCVTRKTTSTHIEHIMAKLGAHSQAQAVAFAVRDNVLGARTSVHTTV
jgi:two-component system response regulator TtrR